MTGGDEDGRISDADAELEREIRQSRKFSPQEALGRMAGPGAMKGASAISPQQQAENEIGDWLRSHVDDPTGALRRVLHRQIMGSALFLDALDTPLVAVAGHFERVLSSVHLLSELVREADVEWGRAMGERPYFEHEGAPRHPDDPYTLESVRQALENGVGEFDQNKQTAR